MLQDIIGVVTPVFLIALIGYQWIRWGQPFDNQTVASVVMTLGTPALVYTTITQSGLAMDHLADMALATSAIMLGSLILGWLLLRLLGWNISAYLPAIAHPNTGNMGLPMVLLAFGEAGLALGVAYFFVNSISQHSIGYSLSSGTLNPKQILQQPILWAVAVSILVLATDWHMPVWFNATAEILSGLTIPAMLLLLGTSLARLNISHLRQTLVVAIARLIICVGMALLVINWLQLEGITAGVLVLQSAMPAAVFNYAYADRFGRDPDKVAAVVLVSTLLAVLVLPFAVGYSLGL